MTNLKKRVGTLICVILSLIFTLSLAACDTGDTSTSVLESIAVTSAPSKTDYTEGEYFSTSGMRVTAYYSDESSRLISGYTYSPSGALTLSDTVITISYTDNEVTKTTTQAITVSEAVPVASLTGIEITTPPTKTEYTAGETFDVTGMVVSAVYDDGESVDVTDLITYSPSGALTTEDTTITISYLYSGVTYSANQAITVNEGVATIEIGDGAGTYSGMHQIVLDTTGGDGDLYVRSDALKTAGGQTTWTYNGTYTDSPFGRAQTVAANQYITFTLDFSDLDDTSNVGFSANLIKVRARTVVTVSTDGENWTDIGYADNNLTGGEIWANYSEVVTSLRGRTVGDPNLCNFYYELGQYIGTSKVIYVRCGFSSDYTNSLTDQNYGADVIDHVCYYDSLIINNDEIAALESIAITTEPTKTEYAEGETFSTAGMVITGYFDDGSEKDLTSIASYSTDALTTSDTEIEISITYRNVTLTVKQSITVSKAAEGTTYFNGGSYIGAHQVVLDTTGGDGSIYTRSAALAAVTGETRITWTNSGTSFGRAYAQATDQYITFTLDFSALNDVSKVGLMANLNKSRQNTLVSVSIDGENWTDISYYSNSTLIADYSEHRTDLRGYTISDANVYGFYWSLGSYMGTSKVIYVRFGFSTTYYENKGVGADLIDHIEYYDTLNITAA